jgi:TonB-linked SusC/RagA family outer membrane protein
MKKTSMLTVSAISYGYRKYLIALILVTLLILVNLVPASALPVAPDNNPVVTNATEGNQKQKITGVVTDADTKEPLVGVTVLSVTSKGLKRGTVTDNNGKFSLDISDRNANLIITYIGYEKLEVKLGASNNYSIELKPQSTKLNEVVVVGYGTQTKATLTGSISSVNSTDLATSTAANPIQRLQGKTTGVNILNSHSPGGDASITIHGMGTINNNNPLFIIDGVPTKYGMTQVNPDEIESMTVLKDASSASIYGARGANGVIIITTKRGTSGKPKISISARNGFGNATNQYNLLNTQEYGQLLWLEAKNGGVPPSSALYGSGATPVIADYTAPAGATAGSAAVDPKLYNYDPNNLYLIAQANKQGTDWYKAIYRTAQIQDYNISISGGTDKGTYAFTAGYYDEQGIMKYTGFKRLSLRSNADAQVAKWLKIGESLGLGYTKGYGNRTEGEGAPISEAYRMQPIIPIYDIMGNFAGTKGTGTGNGENPLAMLYRDQNDYSKDLRAIGNAYAEITLMKDLKFKSLFGFDYRTYNGQDIFIKNPEFQEAKPTDQLTMSNNYTVQWNWVNTVNYSKTIARDHNFKLLAGTEAISTVYNNFGAARSTFFSTDIDYMYLSSGEKDQSNYGDGNTSKTASYFGRFNYDYKGKYLAEATFRRDGSSVFGSNNRWGNFPAFSVGWRISEEKFMASTKSWLDYLKIKGGYGISGNDQIGVYNGFTTFASNNQMTFYGISGNPTGSTAGFSHNNLGNPDAKWETTKTYNVGFDANFFNNTVTASVDLWHRKTSDMLYQQQVAQVAGAYILPSVNIGDMDNKGYDINIGYHNTAMAGELKYDITLTLTHYKNKIVKLSNNAAEFIDGANLRQMLYSRAQVGTAFPEFFGLIVDGIFQTQAEADAYPKEYGGSYNIAGHFKFRDVNKDGVIDDKDRTFIGKPQPDITGGLNIDLAYKSFSLNAFLYTSLGNKVMNYVSRWIDYTQFTGGRSKARLYSSWGSPYLKNNADATLPLADYNTISQYPSTAFLENGSFLRLKNIQLGYSLPTKFVKQYGMGKLEVYIQSTNLFTITKYKGLDPEINSSGTSLGIDQGAWPTTRQFMLGLKIDF